jgi:hypothetical protein
MGRPNLTEHRKFRRLARELDSDVIARGCLELLWDSAYQNGDPYLGEKDDVELAARWKGDPGKLTHALLLAGGDSHAGFIEEVPDKPGHYCVHDLFDHAPAYVQKRKERELERKKRGVTLSEDRRDAALKSHESHRRRNAGNDASGLQLSANDGHMRTLAVQTSANGATPAPAPAPKENPLSEQGCSDEEGPSTRRSKQPSGEACRLAALLKSEIHRNKADFKITQKQERNWVVTAQRMIDLDGRKSGEIEKLIRWAQRDEFWRTNILSMDKLRDKFDMLQMKCGSQGGESQHTGSISGSGKSVEERLAEQYRKLGVTQEQVEEATR